MARLQGTIFCLLSFFFKLHLRHNYTSEYSIECRLYGNYVKEKLTSSNQDCDAVDYHFYPTRDNKAKPKEFPHMAAIGYDGKNNEKLWRCSGSLISEKFVLTAAHCLNHEEYGEAKYVRIGDLVLNADQDDAKPQEFKIAEKFKHPSYQAPSYYNDIGLIKIDKDADLNPYARPACLETSSNVEDGTIITSSWGKSEQNSNEFDPNLLMEDLRRVSNSDCKNAYRNFAENKLKNGINQETQMCAGPENQSQKCLLGTGGPLQMFNKDVFCTYKIIGIKSFGRACGDPSVPDVFTKVSPYVEWIEGIVWP